MRLYDIKPTIRDLDLLEFSKYCSKKNPQYGRPGGKSRKN